MSSDARFYKLVRLNLPNGGNQATISINACYGYGTNNLGLVNTYSYYVSNYHMTAHIYSSHALNSRAVLPGSLGSGDPRYGDNIYSLFYNGVVVVSSPFINPLGIY